MWDEDGVGIAKPAIDVLGGRLGPLLRILLIRLLILTAIMLRQNLACIPSTLLISRILLPRRKSIDLNCYRLR